MADTAQLVEQVIRPALAASETVISDRFLLANVVYQGHAGGLDVARLWEIGSFITQGVQPDLTFLTDAIGTEKHAVSNQQERRDRPDGPAPSVRESEGRECKHSDHDEEGSKPGDEGEIPRVLRARWW